MDNPEQHSKDTTEDTPLRTDPNGFDRFQNSTVWFDMRNLIEDRIEFLQDRLIQSETTQELQALKNQMKAWKEMLGIPSYLKKCAHAESAAQQRELELDEEN